MHKLTHLIVEPELDERRDDLITVPLELELDGSLLVAAQALQLGPSQK